MKLPEFLTNMLMGALPQPIWERHSRRHIARLRAQAWEAAYQQWLAERRAAMADLDERIRLLG